MHKVNQVVGILLILWGAGGLFISNSVALQSYFGVSILIFLVAGIIHFLYGIDRAITLEEEQDEEDLKKEDAVHSTIDVL